MVYMRSDNIKAYVDLSGLTDGDFPNTKIHISVPGDESVISVTPEYFDLNIDTYAVKTLPAVIEVFGTVNVSCKDKNFVEFDSVNVLDADGNTVTGLDVMPSQVRINVKMKEETRIGNLPMKAETTGEPAKGYKVGKITIDPPVATLTAPISYFEKNSVLSLDPIDVTGARDTIRKTVTIPKPAGGSTAVSQTTVTIEIDKD